MNALDGIIFIYALLVAAKLFILLAASLTLVVLTSLCLSSRGANVFNVGALVAAVVALLYAAKRLYWEYEAIWSEWPRLFPLAWAIYASARRKECGNCQCIAILVLLWIISCLTLFKMRFPLNERFELRV